jgi:hypothetical protein
MKLVMVHGRAQGGRDRKTLEQEWLDALQYGLDRANTRLPASTTVEFPYYGDRLDQLVAEADAPLALNINARGTATDVDQDLRGEILMEFAKGLGLTEDDVARESAEEVRERGPQNWLWVHAIARAMDRIPGVNAETIDAITRDVYVYLAYPAARRVIDTLAAAAIGTDECVVLAHSLGTIVAYNVLATRAAAPKCPRLITVGSPLGVRAIKRFLATPVVSPPCVSNWFNAFDRHDIVALNPLDAAHFDVTPTIDNKDDVTNFTSNRHGIAGYLADPVVASKIAEFL